MRRILVFLLLFLLIMVSAFSKERDDIYSVLNVDMGLQQNSILQLTQDSQGFLWIGTQSGLSRWDGKNILNFPRDEGDAIPSGYIHQLVKDSQGWLWIIAGDEVLYSWNNKKFSSTFFDTSDLNSPVTYMLNDRSEEQLLLITQTGVIWSLNKKDSSLSRKAQNAELLVNCHTWVNNDLWLGTENGWFILNEDGGLQQVDTIAVYDCLEYNGRILNSRGKSGISILDPETHGNSWISRSESHSINSFYAGRIISSSWSGTFSQLRERGGVWHESTLKAPDSLNIRKSCTLESGHVVFGSNSEGLYMFNPYLPHFENWSPGQAQSMQPQISFSPDIMSFTETEDQILWLAVYNGGIIKFDREQNRIRGYRESLGNVKTDNIKHITSDQSGRIWVSSYDGGFLTYDPVKDRFISPEIQDDYTTLFRDLRVNHILARENGTLLISTQSGLFEYNPEDMNLTSFSQEYGDELSIHTWSTWLDERGTLWIGTDNGLYSLNQSGTLIHHKSKFDRIWFITESSEGEIITGSPSGIEFFNLKGESLPMTNLENTLRNRSIYGVVQDQDENYWITTNMGALYWNRKEDRIDFLNADEGLLSNEFNLYSLGTLRSGHVFLGSIKGFSLINPTEILPYGTPPQISINNIEVINLSKNESNRVRNLPQEPNNPVILEPDDKILTIHFTPVCFHSRETIKTRYLMEGFSSEWIDTTGQDSINFVNLPPGHYTLKLMAYQNNTDFSHIVSQEITVKPSFFQTTFFYLILILSIISIIVIVAFYIIKLRIEIRHRIKAEKKQARMTRELEELQDYLKDIIDSMPSQLVGINGEGRIILWNNHAASENKLSAEEAKLSLLGDIMPDLLSYWEKVVLSIENQRVTYIDKESFQDKNEMRYRDITIFPLTSTHRKGAVIRIDDVTEQVALEQQILHTEKLSSLGKLAAGIAHDMNNLLTPILGYTDLLLININENEENRILLNQVIESGEKARNLIKQLLNYSRGNKQQYNNISLPQLILGMEKLLGKSLDNRITLDLGLDRNDCEIHANAEQVEQILLNLVVNAAHAMPDGGKLRIDWNPVFVNEEFCKIHTTSREGNFICLTVTDTGTGIDEETKKKIFEPFFSTKGNRGTGLGLATVLDIMQNHRGFILVESELGRGTEFRLFFPPSKT